MKILTIERRHVKNPTEGRADVLWSKDDTPCFGDLFGSFVNPECRQCDAFRQCADVYDKRHPILLSDY